MPKYSIYMFNDIEGKIRITRHEVFAKDDSEIKRIGEKMLKILGALSYRIAKEIDIV